MHLPAGCIAFAIPSLVSLSLATAEEERTILVLYFFPPLSLSLSHSISVFVSFLLPEAVTLRTLTYVS